MNDTIIKSSNNSLQPKKNVLYIGATGSQDLSPAMLYNDAFQGRVGANTGNMIIGEYGRKALNFKDSMENMNFPFDLTDKKYDSIDQVVILAANWVAKYFQPNCTPFTQALKERKLPVVILGLGTQMPIYDDIPTLVKDVNPTLLELIRHVSENSHSISVRGESTKKALEALGIQNCVVTGCPSFFVNGHNERRIVKKELGKNPSLLLHGQPGIPGVFKAISELYRNYPQCSYLIQSEFPLIRFIYDGAIKDFSNSFEFPKEVLERKNWGKVFTSVSEWNNYIKDNIDLSIGCRIHGTISTLKAGKPAIIIPHDSRTREMAELFSIPSITVEEFTHQNFSIENAYEKADFNKMHDNYSRLLENYKTFLDNNNLPHNLAVENSEIYAPKCPNYIEVHEESIIETQEKIKSAISDNTYLINRLLNAVEKQQQDFSKKRSFFRKLFR